MAPHPKSEPPIILRTERLILRLADPNNDSDCQSIVDMFTDENGGKGGNSRVGVESIVDVRLKHRVAGPTPENCPLSVPPKGGMFHLMYLPSAAAADDDDDKASKGTVIGQICMSFRSEMPWPDIGYMIKGEYQSKGYTSEAGRRVLQWWREEIGVREIWCGALPDNWRSQKCAESLGFVRAGTFDIVFGNPPSEDERIRGAPGYVLPGMKWLEGVTIYPTIH